VRKRHNEPYCVASTVFQVHDTNMITTDHLQERVGLCPLSIGTDWYIHLAVWRFRLTVAEYQWKPRTSGLFLGGLGSLLAL